MARDIGPNCAVPAIKAAGASPEPLPTISGLTFTGNGAATVDQAALDKKFAEDLSGVVFAGNYSVTIAGKEKPAEMEKYVISRVSKVKDKEDVWLFVSRIQYGKTDVEIPLALQVKWAGDTPVITLTNLTIPGLGTFTSRVMIYGDRYAGTWQHGKTGGHLWGRIEKIEKPGDPDGKTPERAAENAK
jgi:hypothetical protein